MKVIFDTNFWSYLADSGFESEFLKIEKNLGLECILLPSILLEVQKTKDRNRRISIINVMNKKWRPKSRTEADLESEEMARELTRHFPAFRKSYKKVNRINRLRKFWTKKIWDTAISGTDYYHKSVKAFNDEAVAEIVEKQNEEKELYKKAKWDLSKATPSDLKVKPTNEFSGYQHFDPRKEYDHWRVFNLAYYRTQLNNFSLPKESDGRTVVDWCDPLIKVKKVLEREDLFYQFWLECAESVCMQRNLLRSAVNSLQPFRKVSEGNPYDEQHSSYMVGVDFFFTSDKRYFHILHKIYEDDVIEMAKPILLEPELGQALSTIQESILESM